MNKRRFICVLSAALAIASAAAARAQTAQAVLGSIVRTVYGSGTVQPVSQPGVYAGTDGTVGEIAVGMGDTVRAGDVLISLESDSLDAEIAELERALSVAQDAVEAVATHEQYEYRILYDDDGEMRYDVNTGEPLRGKYSNEITIYAPCDGRIMAIYIEPGDDALAVYREKGAVAMISTDGRMKVELTGLSGSELALGDAVRVTGEGVDAEGTVVSLTRRGTEATVQVIGDTYEMDTPVSVTTASGETVGEGLLVINKPMAVSAYGGTIKGLAVKKGDMVKRYDVMARIVWDEIPLYIDNDSILRDYVKAKLELEAAIEKREALKVTAPCDGTVVSVEVSTDDSVSAGDRLLKLVGEDGMTVTLAVDELDIVSVEPGQRVTLTVDALEDAALTGVVEKIAPLGNVGTGVTTYDVTVELGDVDERVRGGMNVSGNIETESAKNAVLVPTEALRRDAQGWYVTLAGGEQRPVTLGLMTDATTQIASGLSGGETVVY